ncbi:MAG: hypothetical protein AAB648_02345 [Patescibacteria group bacterium]
MNQFEYKPEEKRDPLAAMEELKYGRFSMSDEEKKQIIKKALAEGKDPQEALREHEEKLAKATGRIREDQKEEALKNLERDINKQFRDKERKSE